MKGNLSLLKDLLGREKTRFLSTGKQNAKTEFTEQ